SERGALRCGARIWQEHSIGSRSPASGRPRRRTDRVAQSLYTQLAASAHVSSWHRAEVFCTPPIVSPISGTSPVPNRHLVCLFMPQTCRNCHREPNRPISFLFRPRTSLRCSRGGHPRNPARDVRTISLVLCAKRALQRRLFIGNDEQVEGQPEQCAEQ